MRWLVVLVMLSVAALLPWLVSPYVQDLLLKITIYAIFAASLQLLVGSTGLISLGHAAYFGIAAYSTVLASGMTETPSPLVLLPLALAGAGLYALLVGALCLRTRGLYFIMVTLSFAQMAYFVFHDTDLAGGSDGIFLSSRSVLELGGYKLIDLEQVRQLYWFALACLTATCLLLVLIKRSRFGHALAGIRVNEQRMRAAGYNTYLYKLAAFVIAGTLAGLAGFLVVTKNGVANPELLSWHESGGVLLMLILGGQRHVRGAVLGAAAFILLQEMFSSEALFGRMALSWQLTLGLTMIVLVASLPHGLLGLVERNKAVRGKAGGQHGH